MWSSTIGAIFDCIVLLTLSSIIHKLKCNISMLECLIRLGRFHFGLFGVARNLNVRKRTITFNLGELFNPTFVPSASGPKQCNMCLQSNATSCSKNQQNQTCATGPNSLGTSHCGTAVGKYRDSQGNLVNGFLRGCINCAGKKGGSVEILQKWPYELAWARKETLVLLSCCLCS